MRSLPIGATTCVVVSLIVTVLSHGDLSPDRYLDWGAKSTVAMVESGEWWRLISASFLHAGALHWLLNAAIILGFGGAVETLYHRSDALLVYATAALATTIASTITSDGLALGASGIALGCLSCTTMFALRFYHQIQPRARFVLLAATVPTALAYLAGGFFAPDVDNAGHIAGALAGILAGLALDPRERSTTIAWLPVGAILLVSGVSALVPWSSVDWRPLYPADDVRIAIPSTFIATSPQSYENTLGTSILVETSDAQPSTQQAFEAYRSTVLERFAEAEGIAAVHLGDAERADVGGHEALVLPLSFDGPRGPMVGWHVWVASRHTTLHAVWTARANRRAQNEALFRTWLQHFSFSS